MDNTPQLGLSRVTPTEKVLAPAGGCTQRIRDPVHGLIVFREGDPLAQLAWRLIGTPEFQRLRRIKQLGVSEFVFPGATHSRFAHSVGVFHVARTLVDIIKREFKTSGETFNEKRAEVAVIAALLHDLGHGPFSHTFESVQRSRAITTKKHEQWSAEIIRNPDGKIRPLLDAYRPDGTFTEAVAGLLKAEDPVDIYHAVVSSSFDADRLDYLRRDRLMTGTGAGAIDFDWLMEQLRVDKVKIEAVDEEVKIEAAGTDGDDEPIRVSTFCLDPKALPAAEQFLLARYTLHEQVYFHKTTRCIEYMIAKLLRQVAELVEQKDGYIKTGLDEEHPLVRFFRKEGGTVTNFLALDDIVVGGAIERMVRASDPTIADLGSRLRVRNLYKTLDLRAFGHDGGRQRREARRIDQEFANKLKNGSVIKDDKAAISIYTQIGGDDDKTHKKLHILDARGPREISDLSPIVRELAHKKQFTRYYFESEADRDKARNPRERETD
jgi:HD superfamily phosphohydrolase